VSFEVTFEGVNWLCHDDNTINIVVRIIIIIIIIIIIMCVWTVRV